MNAVETAGLGKHYRNRWALRGCTLAIPAGHVVALVGPNGAGKTTLLHSAVGLTTPTEGKIAILDNLSAGSFEALERVAFVAQDAPLHQHVSVMGMLELTRCLNRRFDSTHAKERLVELGIPLDKRVGKLSGGQQAQLALTLALASHPDLLVLDEPLARLDPLARHDLMALIMTGVAEAGLSVVFSSHVVSELERVADYLVVLAQGRLQLAGEIDDLVARHAVFSGPADNADLVAAQFAVVQERRSASRVELVVRTETMVELPSGWQSDVVTLEELVLAYLREPLASLVPGPLALAAPNNGVVSP